MTEILARLGPIKYYILGIVVICVVWGIGATIYMKKKKGNLGKWLEQHPSAVKVYVKYLEGLIRQGTLTVTSVDGENAQTFMEGTKTGFYVEPGTHVVESVYQTTRPGVLHKTVTEVYGPTKQEIEVKAGRNYEYSFDLKQKSYSFVEM